MYKTKYNEIDNLISLFEQANRIFLEKNWMLFETRVSERTLCGALMLELHEILKDTCYSDYFVDVEYNRNVGGRLKTCQKTIREDDMSIVTINCDLIVHSRGQNIEQDNLIALEMKKFNRPQYEKEKDRVRLQCLTKQSYDGVWSADGRVLPEHVCGYGLGVYYEVNFRRRRIWIEYYRDGERFCEYEVKY